MDKSIQITSVLSPSVGSVRAINSLSVLPEYLPALILLHKISGIGCLGIGFLLDYLRWTVILSFMSAHKSGETLNLLKKNVYQPHP